MYCGRGNGSDSVAGARVLFVVLLSLFYTAAAAGDPCTYTDLDAGPRGCDVRTPDSGCADVKPLSGSLPGEWVADFNTHDETQEYLSILDDMDGGDYLALVPLGRSWGMQLSIDEAAGLLPLLWSPSMIAVRVTKDASDGKDQKPAILLVCGVHAHEWLPQEVCLELVDYYVKAANDVPPYRADMGSVRDLLEFHEIWFVVNSNPAGRKRDDIGTNDGAEQKGDFRQRKNYQWDPDLDCAEDIGNHYSSGKSGDDVRFNRNWNYPGINLGTAFSVGWGDQGDVTFGRNLIAKQPDTYHLSPQQFECGSGTECEAEFGPDYQYCLPYVLGADLVYGCFLADRNPDVASCQSDRSSLGSGLVTSNSSCLWTQTSTAPTYEVYLWECGDTDGSDVTSIDNSGSPIYTENADNPDLLQYCHFGILQSCASDSDCSSAEQSSYDVTINGKNTPHYINQWAMSTHLYCVSETGYEHFHHCAVSENRSCGAEGYAGAQPFEAVEARLIRELVNNYNFSFFVDMHSNRNDFGAICNDIDFNGDCVPIASSYSRSNLRNIHLAAVDLHYVTEAADHWNLHYGGMEAFPDFISLRADGVASPKMGTPPAWPAGKAEVQGTYADDMTSTIYEATLNNFDRDTQRYLPSFQWELGGHKKQVDPGPEEDLWNRLMKCHDGEDMGGKPKSRMMLENQFYGARALVGYLAQQSKIPNVGYYDDPVHGLQNFESRNDVGLQSLRIHDSKGRGVQQTEARWDHVADDSEAQIVVPAGHWYISFDYIAGGDPQGVNDTPRNVINADLSLSVEKFPSASGSSPEQLIGGADAAVALETGNRETMTRQLDFEAGKTYRITAKNNYPITAGHNDDPANDTLVTKVKVLDCAIAESEGTIPNGLDGNDFCRKGIPFPNDAFACHPKGVCRECTITPLAIAECGGGEICVRGICDDITSGCLSGRIEDEYEGEPESVPWFYGTGTHLWRRTLHREGGARDVDEAWFTGHPQWNEPSTPFQTGTYIVNITVRNHCREEESGDPEMTELEIYVDQQVSVGTFRELYHWAPGGGADGWQIPREDSGFQLEIVNEEVVGFLNDQPLRVRVRNAETNPLPALYDIYVTIDYSGLQLGYEGYTAGEPWTIAEQDVLSLDGDGYAADGDGYQVPIFEFRVADELLGTDELAYFSPEESGTMSETTAFIAVDSHGRVTGSYPFGAGRAINLGTLEPSYGPYTIKVQNSEEALAGGVYYCPQHMDCELFDPRRDRCCESGTGDESLCCTDEYGTAACVNVLEDELNCGGCGVECGAGQLCLDGICAVSDGASCAQTACPGETWCCMVGGEPTCRALLLDDENCGSCGWDCPWYGGCLDGYCGVKDSEECSYNCGGDYTCCWWLGWEECVDTDSDPYFCGNCHTVCDSNSECVGGRCVHWWEVSNPCYAGEKNCGAPGEILCLDVLDDETNCGSCGNECAPGSTCMAGVCTSTVKHYDHKELEW